MRPAALHDERWMWVQVWLQIVPDCGFPVLSAFHELTVLRSAAYRPQAEFPAALYEDDPAQTFSLRGISLPAAHTRAAPVPAAWVSICSAAVLAECANHLCAGAAHFLPSVQLWDIVPLAVPT